MKIGSDVSIIGTIVFDIFIPEISKYPRSGQAVDVKSIPIAVGGCGANTSIVLSKLGANVSLIGAVGQDLFGNFIINYLKENNVNIELVKISQKEQTSTSVLIINDQNERSYFHTTGASEEIKVDAIALKQILNSKILHIGGVNLLPSLDGKPMAEILKKAKSRKIVTSIDLAWDTRNRWMKNLKYSLPYIDILMGNKDEILALTSQKKIEKGIEVLHQFGVKIVVVKLGKDGSIVSKDFLIHQVPPFKVKAKDETGAGDAFAGGFLFGILQGRSLFDSAQIGNYIGALVTQEIGSTTILQKINSIDLDKIIP